MSSIRRLDKLTVKAVYYTRMKRDFPAAELRPYSSIEKLSQNSYYLTYGYLQSENLLAYAYFVHFPGTDAVLLDYFAVSDKCRGKGIGGKYIDKFNEFLGPMGIKNVLLEVESIDSGKDETERKIREKRIKFYKNHRCTESGVKALVYDVDYSIMQLCLNGNDSLSDNQIREKLEEFYSVVVPTVLKPGEKARDKFVIY